MRQRTLLIVALAALALSSAVRAQTPGNSPKKDEIVGFREGDAAMNAAIAEARRSLPTFWRLLEADPVVAASGKIKVGFDTPGGPEHMWVREVRREGAVVKGLLDNRPVWLKGFAKGDPVTIDPADISDWSYIREERMYGSYTTRVMLPHLPAEQREAYRKFLSDKPLEDRRP